MKKYCVLVDVVQNWINMTDQGENEDTSTTTEKKEKLNSVFNRASAKVTNFSGSMYAGVLAFSFVLLWFVSGPFFKFSEQWSLFINTGTTIITFLMVFLIQNSQNHDTKAMNEKLDEIIVAIKDADNEFIGIEKKEAAVLEELAHRHENV